MITSVNSIKNNFVHFKGSNAEAKTVSEPIKATVNNEAEITQKAKKVSKTIGFFTGVAIASAIILRRPIKQYKINKKAEEYEQKIHKEIEEKVSTEVNKYNKIFEKTKANAKAEVKDLLEKSKKNPSLVNKLTDGEINTIVALKKNLIPAAVPLLIAALAKTPDHTIRYKPDLPIADEFNTFLSDIKSTSYNSLVYVDSKNQTKYEIQKLNNGYGYSSDNNSRFLMENGDSNCNDIRNLGIVLDRDKMNNAKYSKNKKAAFSALIINNILYKNENNSKKRLIKEIIQLCENNEENENTTHNNNCDFIENDVRREEKRRIEYERFRKWEERKRIEAEKERKRKEFYSDNMHTQKGNSFDEEFCNYYDYIKSQEEEFSSYEHHIFSDDGFDDDGFDDDGFDDGGMF